MSRVSVWVAALLFILSTGSVTEAQSLPNGTILDDVKGLRDVSKEEARAWQLAKHADIKKALARERVEDDDEMGALQEMFELEARLMDSDRRFESLSRLKRRLAQWARAATQPVESPERNQARRLLGAVSSGASARVQDSEYLKLIQQYRRGPGQ